MKKHIFLGVNSNRKTCCILKSLLPFDALEEPIEASDFTHDATNWCGQDDIKRTCELRKLSLTGREINLAAPIEFFGVDSDMGHQSEWRFVIDKIYETT